MLPYIVLSFIVLLDFVRSLNVIKLYFGSWILLSTSGKTEESKPISCALWGEVVSNVRAG
jgi:hypothetical protein